jgi:hypothetical protein
MKSFNQFLNEAEKVPERQQLNLSISPGQQSLPGMGKKKDKPAKPVTPAKGSEYLDPKTGQASDEGVRRYMNKRNTKGYFRTEGKPSAVKPEDVKAGLEKTKVDMQNPQEVQSVKDKINQKYGRKPADDAFAKKLGLDTPEGAAAAQDAAKDMAADAKKGQTNLKGGPTPQVKPNKTVKPTAPAPAPTAAQVRPRGQGSRPVGSTATRGGVQLPNLPKPKVTLGRGVQVVAPPTAQQAAVTKAVERQRVSNTKPDMPTQIRQTASQVIGDREKAKLDRSTQRATAIGKAALPIATGASAFQSYNYGRSQGDTTPEALARATVVPAVTSSAAKRVGKSLIKRKLPSWAVPAAAATYGAVEPAAQWGFSKIKDFIKGNK